jgi:lysophospholipase L1-like esterase
MDPATRADLRHGLFGLGGVMFGGRPGAQARFTLDDARHGSIELAYLVQPGGGSITVTAGETVLGEIGTDGPVTASGYATFALPPGAQTVEIQVTSGYVRLFGIRFDKPGPGIVYNSLGLNGAHVTVLSRAIREHHLAEQLRHYAPDLVIVNYGTNESIYSEYVERELARELKEALRRVRAAAPKASILVMSPMDRGERQEDGEIGTPPALERLIAIEEAVSRESDCAFFNTFRAMGGHGTMGRWYHAQPRLVGGDFIHPTPAGASIVGRLLAHSLMTGYNRYKLRQLRLARN